MVMIFFQASYKNENQLINSYDSLVNKIFELSNIMKKNHTVGIIIPTLNPDYIFEERF